MSNIDPAPTYACGNTPQAGDLIEFGTRHRRMIVLEVCDEGPTFSINCAGREYHGGAFDLMVLIARHGVALKS